MYPHRIRLRGPWDCEPLVGPPDRPLPPPRRMTLPCRWAESGLVDFAGRVLFRRRFGYPGRIDDYERVWLTFAGVEGEARAHLNGHFLGREDRPDGFEYEVTALLQPRNELAVEVTGPATGGLWGEVALEVRRTAFLRNVRARAELVGDVARLQVDGEVAGTAERPLELYAVLDRFTVAYGRVEAAPQGRSFILISDDLPSERRQPPGPHVLRVDLVDGATVWYTVDLSLDFSTP